jgi:DNA-binding response OmpR family regulator
MNFEHQVCEKTIELGQLRIERENRTVRIFGKPVEMSTAEFDLLWLLASHAGEILTRDLIYEKIRGFDYDGLDRSIDLRVSRLRKKLGDSAKRPRLIKSVRGIGYLFVRNPCVENTIQTDTQTQQNRQN